MKSELRFIHVMLEISANELSINDSGFQYHMESSQFMSLKYIIHTLVVFLIFIGSPHMDNLLEVIQICIYTLKQYLDLPLNQSYNRVDNFVDLLNLSRLQGKILDRIIYHIFD